MPRTPQIYNATPTSQTVPFHIPSGAGKELVVWQETGSDVKLVKCDLCGRFMPLQGQSMSTSALKRHRNGAGRKNLVKQKLGINPSGRCGKDKCKTQLAVVGKSMKITSNCEYHYENMKYRLALANQTPCTNVPLNCPMYPQLETFWKYRFIDHITERHLTESIELPSLDIPLDLWATTHISKCYLDRVDTVDMARFCAHLSTASGSRHCDRSYPGSCQSQPSANR